MQISADFSRDVSTYINRIDMDMDSSVATQSPVWHTACPEWVSATGRRTTGRQSGKTNEPGNIPD